MNPKTGETTPAAGEIPEDLPFVPIIIPFELKMKSKEGFDCVVNAAVAKSERELLANFPEEVAKPVMEKMHRVLMNLDYTPHHGKSIGIFISPLVEKVYYFNYDTSLNYRV